MQKGLLLVLTVLFLSLLTMSSCKKDSTPDTCSNGIKDNDETGIDCGGSCTACSTPNIYYFEGNVDGSNFRVQDTMVYSNSIKSSSMGDCTYGVGGNISHVNFQGFATSRFTLHFSNIYNGSCTAIDTNTVYSHLLVPGRYTNNEGPNDTHIKVSLFKNSIDYRSDLLGAQPAGSYLEILESTPIAAVDGKGGVLIKAKLTYQLVSYQSDYIQLTDCEVLLTIYDYE